MKIDIGWKLNRANAGLLLGQRTEILDAIERYVLYGHAVGHFLTAVLENDLKESCGRADPEMQVCLFDLVRLLYNDVPMLAWGSPEKVLAWQEHQGFEGLLAMRTKKAAELMKSEDDEDEPGI